MKYKKLAQPGYIGKLEIKNRVVCTPMGTGLANADGSPSQVYIDYVTERAKGGLGLFITEIVQVDEEYGQTLPCQLRASRTAHIEPWRRLAESLHKYDCKLFAQLHHPGRSTSAALLGGKQPVSSGNQPGKRWTAEPRMLTKEEIKTLVQKFATGASLMKAAGVDGVELHAAHTYLIHQFMTSWINNRTDEYGGSFENRMRFLTEIIFAIREAVGPDYPLSVRISAQEYYEGGYGLDEGVKIAKYLDDLGVVDVLNLSNGVSESTYTIQEPPTFEQGWKIGNAEEIKKHVKIPVIATAAIREPAYAEEVLEKDQTDFVAVTRGHLADPYWVSKALWGEDVDIRKCVQCLACFAEASSGGGIRCAINPLAGRERELGTLEKNGDGRVVAVIGGGPAGLEAARVLALRGFKAVLFESSNQLGGALQLANKPLHKQRIDWLIDTMVYQTKQAGAEIKLNTAATVDELKKLNPYAVIVATGCQPIEMKVPGCDAAPVHEAVDYLNGDAKITGKRVAVVGGGTTGCEIAEKLATEGKDVTIIEMREDIGLDMFMIPRMDFMIRLNDLGVKSMVDCALEEVDCPRVVCRNVKTGELVEEQFDEVILSIGFKPLNDLVQPMRENFERVRVIGDAVKVRKIMQAVSEGYSAGFALA